MKNYHKKILSTFNDIEEIIIRENLHSIFFPISLDIAFNFTKFSNDEIMKYDIVRKLERLDDNR